LRDDPFREHIAERQISVLEKLVAQEFHPVVETAPS
jgi:hypothetical protein